MLDTIDIVPAKTATPIQLIAENLKTFLSYKGKLVFNPFLNNTIIKLIDLGKHHLNTIAVYRHVYEQTEKDSSFDYCEVYYCLLAAIDITKGKILVSKLDFLVINQYKKLFFEIEAHLTFQIQDINRC